MSDGGEQEGEADQQAELILENRTQPPRLDVSEHLRPMEQGGSGSQLIRAVDGKAYVTKFHNTSQGSKILANEYMVAEIGRLIGAPVPEIAILEVPQEFIEAASIEVNNETAASGLQFGSAYATDEDGKTANKPTQSHLSDFVNKHAIPATIGLDTLVLNDDVGPKHVVFHSEGEGYRFWAIDHGHCLGQEDPWSSLDATQNEMVVRMDEFLDEVQGPDSFEDVISSIEDDLTGTAIRDIGSEMPLEEWGVTEDELDALARFIEQRKETVSTIIDSNQDMFPNWGEE